MIYATGCCCEHTFFQVHTPQFGTVPIPGTRYSPCIGNYMVLWVLGDTQCLNATLFCGAADSLKHSEHSLGIKVTM